MNSVKVTASKTSELSLSPCLCLSLPVSVCLPPSLSHTHAHTHARKHTHTQTRTHANTHMHARTHAQCTHTRRARAHTHTPTHPPTPPHTHTHTNARMHTLKLHHKYYSLQHEHGRQTLPAYTRALKPEGETITKRREPRRSKQASGITHPHLHQLCAKCLMHRTQATRGQPR